MTTVPSYETAELKIQRISREARQLAEQQATEDDALTVWHAGKGAIADVGLRAFAAEAGVEPTLEAVRTVFTDRRDYVQMRLAQELPRGNKVKIAKLSEAAKYADELLEMLDTFFTDVR